MLLFSPDEIADHHSIWSVLRLSLLLHHAANNLETTNTKTHPSINVLFFSTLQQLSTQVNLSLFDDKNNRKGYFTPPVCSLRKNRASIRAKKSYDTCMHAAVDEI